MGCKGCIDKARAAGKIVKVVAGFNLAREETVTERAEECKGCEFSLPCKHKPERKCKCGECGCFITLKIRLKNERCPVGKWTEEQ